MASALHCGGTLPLTQELARHAHSWEMRMLRQAFRMRPAEGETEDSKGWERYYSRSQKIIEQAKSLAKRPFLVHRLLKAYLQEAWDEKTRTDRDGSRRTRDLRLYRSRLWWRDVMQIPYHHRRAVGWTHGRAGVPLRQWEDLLVEVRGVSWRQWRDSFNSVLEWQRHTQLLIDEICEMWGLPCLEVKGGTLEAHRDKGPKAMPWPSEELKHRDDAMWMTSG